MVEELGDSGVSLVAGRLDRSFNKSSCSLNSKFFGRLLLTLLLVGHFGMGPHGFELLNFLAALWSNVSLTKICSVTSKVKTFSPIV